MRCRGSKLGRPHARQVPLPLCRGFAPARPRSYMIHAHPLHIRSHTPPFIHVHTFAHSHTCPHIQIDSWNFPCTHTRAVTPHLYMLLHFNTRVYTHMHIHTHHTPMPSLTHSYTWGQRPSGLACARAASPVTPRVSRTPWDLRGPPLTPCRQPQTISDRLRARE